MTYKASLDKTGRIITVSVTLIFMFIILVQYIDRININNSIRILTSAVLAAIYFGTYALAPLGYIVNFKELIIRRPLANIRIKKTNIQRVEIIDRELLKRSIRVFGDGGLFGYYGKFSNSQMGLMTWYITRRDKLVLVLTADNRKIILSPDDPHRFVAEFNY